MTYHEVTEYANTHLLPLVSKLYELEEYDIKQVKPHEGGRNLVYCCEKEGASGKIIRIVFLSDRSLEDVLSEVEFIRYLFEHGASVSNVISSKEGNLVEAMTHDHHNFYICLFDKAKGKMLAENNYRYIDGVPITEYYYNCGKVLGKMHQLSKSYTPVHRRYRFFDKYNVGYITSLIPDSLSLLKEKLIKLLETLGELDKDQESFGIVHFDYSDGNYMIDFETGQITVYDFDNSCYCWYMYDLANLWLHGVGWIQFEQDVSKRKKFMEDYFETVLAGYKSETSIDNFVLSQLLLFIQVVLMENIVDAFEVRKNNGDEMECDEELSYLIKCLEDDIPYQGFFHDIYSCKSPFTYEERSI